MSITLWSGKESRIMAHKVGNLYEIHTEVKKIFGTGWESVGLALQNPISLKEVKQIKSEIKLALNQSETTQD